MFLKWWNFELVFDMIELDHFNIQNLLDQNAAIFFAFKRIIWLILSQSVCLKFWLDKSSESFANLFSSVEVPDKAITHWKQSLGKWVQNLLSHKIKCLKFFTLSIWKFVKVIE